MSIQFDLNGDVSLSVVCLFPRRGIHDTVGAPKNNNKAIIAYHYTLSRLSFLDSRRFHIWTAFILSFTISRVIGPLQEEKER